ncbi:MAG: diadenylate cyclase [Ferruginibacter sp.]
MSFTIDLFMWGYQRHIQISLKVSAESLFNEIDKRLKPKVFLLGILTDDRTDRHPICIEPEDCGYSVNAFKDVKSLAQQLEKVNEERNIFHSHPEAQKNHEKRISTNALREAIDKILKKEDLYGDTEKFISYPTYIEGFLVFVILELDKKTLNSYYSLTKEKFNDRYKISRSFIESAIDTYLKESAIALKDPNKGIGAIERPADELLRESGKQFMYSISQAGENFYGLHGLYDACNTISSLKYEGADGLGKMIIAKKDHPNIRLTLQLKEPIEVNDYRKVRKFLELSNDNAVIISDSALIYGLGEQTGKYNPKSESLFVINFISHFKWEVLHDNNPMMIVEYRQPNLPKDRIDRTKFYSDLKRIFKDIDKNQLDNLWEITIEATKQKHGTMLVISDNAKAEAERLGKQSFSLNPLKLTVGIVQQITSIDGSVLIDKDGICHAIGVILDGLATDKGDSSRGARYNSAIRYYEHFGTKHPTVLIIISEDGMINLIPNLRPQVKHSDILEAIKNFEEMSKAEKVERKYFNQAMTYFQNIAFYLTADECDKINSLRKQIEEADKNIESVRIVYNDIRPNKEMNDSYYTE